MRSLPKRKYKELHRAKEFNHWNKQTKKRDAHSHHSIQHSIESPSHSNQRGKRNKNNSNQKGRNKTVTVCKWIPYIENPKDSARKLLEVICEFSKVEWHKINI